MEFSLGAGIAIFGAAFAAWAWVVAWGVGIVRNEISQLRAVIKDTADRQTDIAKNQEQHILLTERRLTMLETEFGYIRRYLAHGADHDESTQPSK